MTPTPTPPRNARLPTVARRVLRELFGRAWLLSLFILLAVIFWPVLLFLPGLAFDPVAFTEEWVKLSATGLLIYLILDILQARRTTEREQAALTDMFLTFFLHPWQELQEHLLLLRQATDHHDTDIRDKIRSLWLMIDYSCTAQSLALISDSPLRSNLVRLIAKTDLERCRAIALSLANSTSSSAVDELELNELIDRAAQHISTLLHLIEGKA